MRSLYLASSLLLGLAFTSRASAASRIEYILDVSGSMKATAGGETRIAAAKKALASMARGIPEGTQVALRLYGHRTPPSDKAGSCRDTELVLPFAPIEKDGLLAIVNAATPLGQTPLAYSLQQAAADFRAGADEQQSIILVSDGEESCGGDPVGTVKALLARGFELKVHVVGMNVDSNARKQLAAIALATGGKYLDAQDAASLTSSLQEMTRASLLIEKAGAVVYGEAIRGGDNYETAVPLAPGSWHLDHHQREKQYDYFFVEARPGQAIVLSIRTEKKGVVISRDGTWRETSEYPNAGFELHGPQRVRIGQETINGAQDKTASFTYLVSSEGAGRYFVLVGSAYADQHKDVLFRLDVQDRFDAGDQTDAGEDEATALPLRPGSYKGFLGRDDLVDAYVLDVSGVSDLTIRARADGKAGQLELELLDMNGKHLGSGSSPNGGAAAVLESRLAPGTGKLLLRVKDGEVYRRSLVEYALHVAVGAAPGTADVASAGSPGSREPAAAAATPTNLAHPFAHLSLWQKLKLAAAYSGIPLLAGWLVGMIWGYVKGRRAGRRTVAGQPGAQA